MSTVPVPGLLPPEMIAFTASPATEPFWLAAREHRLVVPRCTDCGMFRLPPAAFCWNCRSEAVEWVEHDGAGDLYSYTVIRHPVIPSMADVLPIVVAVVELPDTNGCRVVGDLIGCDADAVQIGMPVTLDWYDVDEGSVPCFRPRA